MDSRKNDARYVSEAIGCVLLFSMLLLLVTSTWFQQPSSVSVATLIFKIGTMLFIFVLPAVWGVWILRRSKVRFPSEVSRSSLSKGLPVVLSSFGVIIILQMLYVAFFPSAKTTAGVTLTESPMQIFLLFLSVSFIPALAEEILFRGFLIRSLRVFRTSLCVLMSALAFALMHFSVTGFPLFFVCGLILGMAYVSTGSLSVSVAIHFLCNAFWFLSETVGIYMPEYEMLFMRCAFTVCVLLSVSGIPFLKENMRVFFEGDDERAASSSYFWSLPTLLFVLLAAGIQLFFRGN